MHRRKHCHSRSAHHVPQLTHSTTFQSTPLGPHSQPHMYSTRSHPYPQLGARSAAMAELYTTSGPSGGRRPASRRKGSHFALRSSGHEARNSGSTGASRSSSSPEYRIPREFGDQYQIAASSSSARHSRSNNREPHTGYRRDSEVLHSQSRYTSRCLNSRAVDPSENRGVFEPNDYIRAWQGGLQPPNASSTQDVVPTGSTELAAGLLKTLTTSTPVSALAPQASNSTQKQPTEPDAIQPPSGNSSWLSRFGFGKKPVKPAPQPLLRGRTHVHRRKVFTGPHPSSSVIPQSLLVPPPGTVPAPGGILDVPAGQVLPPKPQHISTATQPLVSQPETFVDIAVQTTGQSDFIEPCPAPSSPVPSLSWLLEDDANDEDGPSERHTISIVPESETAEQHLHQRPPSPSTPIHSLFPPLPPHIPPPQDQLDAVSLVVQSVYDAHPEVKRPKLNFFVPIPFFQSCPETYICNGLQLLDYSYVRLMKGFDHLKVFYEEVNRKPTNSNPSPEFIPIPSDRIPKTPGEHRLTLQKMLSQIVAFKWFLHVLYGTTGGMAGFLRADDTQPMSPEESQSYVTMHNDIRRYTDRARGAYIPPDGVRPKDKLDLDEVRRLVEMLILAGGKMFADDMLNPIATPPTLPPPGPFLITDPRTAVAAAAPAHETASSSQAEVQLAAPEVALSTSVPYVSPPSSSSLQVPSPAHKNSGVTLDSQSPGSTQPTATLNLPDGFLPTTHPQGGIQWSDSQRREHVLWSTDSTVAKEMRSQFVERIASGHPILSALLAMTGDNPDTGTALAYIVQKYLGDPVSKEKKDAISRDELWGLISGPEAFMGMAEVVREVAVQLSRQSEDPAGLDGYIMKGLVAALMKTRESKPEFVHAFCALKEAIPKPPRSVPLPSPMRVNTDSKGKRKRTDDEEDPEHSESPSKRRKLEADARKIPPPSTSIPSLGYSSASVASSSAAAASSSTSAVSSSTSAASSSATHTIDGVTISKSHASASATFKVTPPSSGSRSAPLPRPSGPSRQPTPSVGQNYLRGNHGTPKNAFPPSGQQRSRFGQKLNHPIRVTSPGVRILPDHPGHSGPTTASSSQASASASTSTPDISVSSVEADSSTSSRTTKSQGPAWAQPVYTIKRAAVTRGSTSSTLIHSSSLTVMSSSTSSSGQLASGSYGSSSSHVIASPPWTPRRSPRVSGTHSAVHSTSEAPPWDDPSPHSNTQSGSSVVSGWGGDVQAVSGTLSHAVFPSSASSSGYSVALRPATWDVEMKDEPKEV